MLERLGQLAADWPLGSLAVGLLLLLGGGHLLVEGSVAIARRLGLSPLIIGLTIVAFGTSAPELFFNVSATISGRGELSFGNVVGSNIANLGLVLGLAGLLAPMRILPELKRRDVPMLLGATLAMPVLMVLPISRLELPDGRSVAGFTRIDGLLMLACFVAMIGVWLRAALRRSDALDPLAREAVEEVEQVPERRLPLAIALVVGGLVALVVGGRAAEIGAVGLAQSLGLSEALIGLTVVAVATSLPEVATSLVAARRGHADLAIGNVVGSNLFNLLLVLGASATAAPVPLPDGRGWGDLSAMVGMTLLLPLLAWRRDRLGRGHALVLLLVYLAIMTAGVVLELRADGG